MKIYGNMSATAAMAIVLAGLALAFVAWVVATASGARWLLASAASWSAVGFSAQKIEGSISGHLVLTKVRVTLARRYVELDALELRWNPLLLLTGTIAFQELVLTGVRIQDDTPADNKPMLPASPKASGTSRLPDVKIAHLRVTNLSYRRLRDEPLRVASLNGSFTSRKSLLSFHIKAVGLNTLTSLSGTLNFSGTVDAYQGAFVLVNQAPGWQAATLSGAYHGAREGLKLSRLTGSFLEGTLAGNLDINWRGGLVMAGAFSGRKLNPARIDPDWKGVLNFSVSGNMARSGTSFLSGSVIGALLESRLHGQLLTGELQAKFSSDNLSLSRMALHGKGFDVQASGVLNQRLTLAAVITDLSLLVPGSSGALRSDGWVRLRNGQLTGALAGAGSGLAYAGTTMAAADLTIRLDQGAGNPLHVAATLRDVVSDQFTLNAVTVETDGTLPRHTMKLAVRAADSEARLELLAGYSEGVWKGEIIRFGGSNGNGPWNQAGPSTFTVSAAEFSLSPLALTTGGSERLELAVEVTLKPMLGNIRAQWLGLNLARANHYLKDGRIAGSSHGDITVGFLAGNRLTLTGSAGGSGTYLGQGCHITLDQFLATFEGNEQGVRVAMELNDASGGSLKGTYASPDPLQLLMPEKGELTAELTGLDLALLKPWLPPGIVVEGSISGQVHGIMLPGKRFELDGKAALSKGVVHQERGDGEMDLTVSSSSLSWGWRGEALAGEFYLDLAEHGQVRATVALPVPARFPIAVDPKGSLKAALMAQLQDKGLVSALFPGAVQESFGTVRAELAVNGTWEAPQTTGTMRLAAAGAYLPIAGIRLNEVMLAAHLEKDLITIDSFRARSGPGQVEGTALITLSGPQVIKYHGVFRGNNFQTVHFPELELLSSPELTFDGTLQKLMVRGEVRLPEVRIVGAPSHTAVAPSNDVVREGAVITIAEASPVALDVRVRVLLGDRIFVKVEGIDAQLGGAMDVSLSHFDRISSSGEIKVVKGRYRTYGVNLEIVRGRLFFSGGPLDSPTLDVLAQRTIGDIRVGVTVAGTLQKPVTNLYSDPVMPDVDILAYIVLGHPLGGGEQAGLVAQAAGALLTSGRAAVLQDQIKNRFGLSTLEIQGGVGGTASHMGYKPLPVTAPGAIPSAQQSGFTETMVTVGKYVTPQLYVSNGKSLFTGSNLFLLRYDIYKKWQIETQTGSESGADLFYKMEFK